MAFKLKLQTLKFVTYSKITHRIWHLIQFGEGKILGDLPLPRAQGSDTLWVENVYEIGLSGTVKEIEANLCFAIFGIHSKVQNGRHSWGSLNFLHICIRLHYLDTLWVR